MKKIVFLLAVCISFFVSAQTFIQAYQNRVNQVSQVTINSGLQEFVSLGTKTTGSTANNNAFNWLKNKYLSFGYSISQISENPFSAGSLSSKNLIITKTGTVYPNTFVIVCAHFDTVNGVGANDNGSGTIALLEMARIMKDIPTEYSIKFIHFSGEEQGLYGSQHYVNQVVNATVPKMDIRLVFNIDQVGGRAGQTHNTIVCERDTNNFPSTNNAASHQATSELMNCVALYSPLQTTLSNAYSSDYMPFQNNNEVITGFYEYQGELNPAPHTSADIVANMDPVYLFNVTKAALGALQHFAKASSSLSLSETQIEELSVSFYPNPAKDQFEILFGKKKPGNFRLTLTDLSGRQILNIENEEIIDVSYLQNGVYLATVTADQKKLVNKIIVQK